MVNIQSTQTLIVTLPAAPQTGDIVRMIDVGGNLKYDTTLVPVSYTHLTLPTIDPV